MAFVRITENMNLLISTPQNNFFIVAIGEKNVADFRIVKKEYGQAEWLLKTIEHLLKQQNSKTTKQRKIQNVYVVEGPGAFSALRVGIATANSLAYSLNVPVFGIRIEKEWENLTPEEQLKKIWNKAINIESRLLRVARRNNSSESGLLRFARRNNSSESGLLRFARNKFVTPFYGMEPHITSKNSNA